MNYDLSLTKQQFNKMMKGENFQLSNAQLNNQHNKNVSIMLHPKTFTRLQRALRNGKGFRFRKMDYEPMEGGAVLDDMKRGFNNFGKQIKNGITDEWNKVKRGAKNEFNNVRNRATDEFNTVRSDLTNQANQKIKQYRSNANDYVNLQLDNAKKLGKKTLNDAVGQGERYANIYANKISDYANNKANQLSDQAMNKLNDMLEQGNDYLDKKMNGGSLRKGRFKKGSQEAKEHMAKIREMRKMKGGNIEKLLKKAVYKIGDEIKDNSRRIAYKVGDDLKRRGTHFVNNELRDGLKNLAQNATDGGISALKSVANYVMPGSDMALEPGFDRLEQVANRQINRQINKIRIKGGAVNPVTHTVINSTSNEGLHYPIQWTQEKRMKGGSFIQV